MQKITIKVPPKTKHLSDWRGFEGKLPSGHVVLNKGVTGCGFTYWALETCKWPTILCYPRLELGYTKAKQHPHAHIFRPEKNKKMVENPWETTTTTPDLDDLKNEVVKYVKRCQRKKKTPKILVTFDSFHHVKSALSYAHLFDRFVVVVDEMQCLFSDARFKGAVEMEFLRQLQVKNRVIYVSATPYTPGFLNNVSYFSRMTYVTLDWPTPNPYHLALHKMKSIAGTFSQILRRWRVLGFFDLRHDDSGVYFAEQAVFFLNNVTQINTLITKFKLKPSEVCVLCSKEAKLAQGFKRGSAPLQGKKHKPITFVTRAAFEGVDFHHPNAATFIFANTHVDAMALDTTTDLPQILGRQRLDSNPFKYYAHLFYVDHPTLTPEEIQAEQDAIEARVQKTKEEIGLFNRQGSLDDKAMLLDLFLEREAKTDHKSYLQVARNTYGVACGVVENELEHAADLRALEIRSTPYSKFYSLSQSADPLEQFIDEYCATDKFARRFKLYANLHADHPDAATVIEPRIDPRFPLYLPLVPICGYNEERIKAYLAAPQAREEAARQVKALLTPGSYSRAEVKKVLQGVYDAVGLKKKAKSTDLPTFIDGATEKRVYVEGKRVWGWVVP